MTFWCCNTEKNIQNFNSHPHEEDDTTCFACFTSSVISTHILTKRMTHLLLLELPVLYISTHILTKRMTSWKFAVCNWSRISTHILTKRMTCYHNSTSPLCYFNSHPHEEDDNTTDWNITIIFISTHILTKRMTAILNKNNLFKIAYYISNKHFISIVDIFFHFHIYF